MGKCMSKVKDEFPEGRSDKKKGKKAAHKQHVAMCLNVKEEKRTMTFIDFLNEVDVGDIRIHQQHQQKQQDQAAMVQGQQDFKDKLGDNPDRGDVVIVRANRYIVVGGNREGTIVKQIGSGGQTTTIPHGTKFKKVGVSQNSGKVVFKALVQ